MKSYIENEEKIKSPIKYYRNLLDITQKELAGEKYTRGYIQSLESGKRVPAYKCAVYLIEKIKEIANEKKIKIDITIDEIMKNEKERLHDFFLKRIVHMNVEQKSESDIKNYKDLVSVIKEYNFTDLQKKVNTLIADELLKCKKYMEAIEYYNTVIEGLECKEFTLNGISILRRIGTCFYMIQDYDKSIQNYSKAEELYISNQLDDSDEYIKILINISLALKKKKDIVKSIQYIKKALCLENVNEKMVYNLKLQLGNNYQDIKKYEKALGIYEELYKQYSDDYLLNYNIAITYDFLEKRDQTEKYLEKCLSSKFENNEEKSIYSLMLLGKIKLEKKENAHAEKCFDYALDIASKFKDGEMIIYTISNIYELLQKNGLSYKFVKYFESIILNEDIILKNKNNISEILIVLLKCSVEIELSKEDKDKIKNIIEIIERGKRIC